MYKRNRIPGYQESRMSRGVRFAALLALLVAGTLLADHLLRFQPSVASAAGGQVLINEVEQNPPGPDADQEWVELYNPTQSPVDLEAWTLSTAHGQTVTLPASEPIPPGGYLVIIYMAEWLSNVDEQVILCDRGKAEVDRTPVQSDTADDDGCWGRFPDGQASWLFMASTQGAPNMGEPVPEGALSMISAVLAILGAHKIRRATENS